MSTSLKGIMAQRLIRRLCTFCKEPTTISPEAAQEFGLDPAGQYYKAGRCSHCQDTGYLGRDAISEVIPITDQLMRLIAKDASLDLIEDACRQEGFTDLRTSGINKVRNGITSVEELSRVIG